MYRYSQFRGDPGLLRSLGRVAGRVAGAALRSIPIINTGYEAVRAFRGPGGSPTPALPAFQDPRQGGAAGAQPGTGRAAARERLKSAIGKYTGTGRRGKRMNVSNTKAARRAIRRIKGVRDLLKSIERELPKRSAPRAGGSRGVITRSEAARALRS